MSGLDAAAPALKGLGLRYKDLQDRLEFEPDLERALRDADAVQESGGERLEFKRELFARIAAATGPSTLLLSSTSGFPASEIARDLADADAARLLVAHPFNPPPLIPLVEVVPGARTAPWAVDRAAAFYRTVGKYPLIVRKERPLFVVNRLQVALFREAVNLVSKGSSTRPTLMTR